MRNCAQKRSSGLPYTRAEVRQSFPRIEARLSTLCRTDFRGMRARKLGPRLLEPNSNQVWSDPGSSTTTYYGDDYDAEDLDG